MIHQELMPFPQLTVAENIFMGHEPSRGFPGWIDRAHGGAGTRIQTRQIPGRERTGGPEGAGRTDLANALFGVAPADARDIRINERSVRIAHPRDASRRGESISARNSKCTR